MSFRPSAIRSATSQHVSISLSGIARNEIIGNSGKAAPAPLWVHWLSTRDRILASVAITFTQLMQGKHSPTRTVRIQEFDESCLVRCVHVFRTIPGHEASEIEYLDSSILDFCRKPENRASILFRPDIHVANPTANSRLASAQKTQWTRHLSQLYSSQPIFKQSQ